MSPIHRLLLAFIVPATLLAQTASLRGLVTDESGAIVPAAAVRLTGPDKKPQTATADSNGAYSFAGLAPGDYSVQASAPQLATARPVKIALKPGSQTLNLQV